MRIEIDNGLEKALDAIKTKEGSISYGRGHAETVRFLADYYQHHTQLTELFEQFKAEQCNFMEGIDSATEASLQRVFPKAIAKAVANLLTYTAETAPTRDQPRPELRSGH